MSQKYIATQKIKEQKIIFQNLQTKNDKSQINFHRMNTINNFPADYNFVKEYLKSREKKDNKQGKKFSLGNSEFAQNLRKGAMNLKKKILTIKTNSESNDQIKKERLGKKIEPANYRPSFTYTYSQAKKPSNDRYKKDSANNNIKKKNNLDIIDLINMPSNSSDNNNNKRNTNTNNHSYFVSNNNNNGYNNLNNNKNTINNNMNKKNGKDYVISNNNNKNGNNDKNSSSLGSEISKDFKKIDFKYITDNITKKNEELYANIKTDHKNTADMIANSLKEFKEILTNRNSEKEKEDNNDVYNTMKLIRYENNIFLTELEKKQNKLAEDNFEKQKKLAEDNFEKQNKLAEDNFEKQKKLVEDMFEKQNKLVKDMFQTQREENMALLTNFILMLNEDAKNKEK